MKLARFDSDGRPVAFFNPEWEYPNEDLSDTVLISDEDWEEFINYPGVRRWDGERSCLATPSVSRRGTRLGHAEMRCWQRPTGRNCRMCRWSIRGVGTVPAGVAGHSAAVP